MPAGPRVRLMQGNEACAEAAIVAGLNFFAGYPITPATEMAELLAELLPKAGGHFMQLEDEIASMAAVVGASMAGAKAMTATSGPGFTLMQENLGYAVMAEIPCVVVNVQRGGPSTGLPTLPAQGDVMQARWGTHGDHPAIALTPSTVEEMYHLTIKAFNLAERFRTPVLLMADAVVGHLREKVVVPDAAELALVERKKPRVPPENYVPFRPEANLVPPMAILGEGYRFNYTSNIHDETGFPATSNHQVAIKLVERLHEKIDRHKEEIIMTREFLLEDAQVAVFAYGCTARSARRAVRLAREAGLKAGMLHALTLWPFPAEQVRSVAARVRTLIVPEMNLGQMVGEVERAARALPVDIVPLSQLGGLMVPPEAILAAVREVI